jgi:arylsulfatase A-like enzyme
MPQECPAPARLLAVALALAGLAAGCDGEPSGEGKGVLVIAVDAWRADPVEGEARNLPGSGRFGRFLSQSVRFTSAWSTSPETLSANASLLTGCDPRLGERPIELFEGASQGNAEWFLPPDVPRLAEAFLAEGWQTAAFVDDVRLAGRSGLDQGFQRFEDPGMALRYEGQSDPYGIDGVARRFHEWLRERDTGERWFAYLELSDLDRMWHDVEGELGVPTQPLAGADDPVLPVADAQAVYFAVPRRRFDGHSRSLREYEALYLLACDRLERKLGGLMTALDTLEWSGRTTIVLVGSHGLGFGESGLVLDTGTLSDVDLHVPLYILPSTDRSVLSSRKVEALVSTMDVGPTVLDLAGVPRLEGMNGETLVRLIRGEAVHPREFAYASSDVVGGWAVIDPRYCYERVTYEVGPMSLPGSWFGLDRPNKDEQAAMRKTQHEFLHDREANPRPGHLGAGVDDPANLDRMRKAGEEWNDLVMRARLVLHDPGGAMREQRPEEIEFLRRRRMLGQLRGPER